MVVICDYGDQSEWARDKLQNILTEFDKLIQEQVNWKSTLFTDIQDLLNNVKTWVKHLLKNRIVSSTCNRDYQNRENNLNNKNDSNGNDALEGDDDGDKSEEFIIQFGWDKYLVLQCERDEFFESLQKIESADEYMNYFHKKYFVYKNYMLNVPIFIDGCWKDKPYLRKWSN
ncbi:hypothetical protein Glove_220g23 [Diversispora epigaea]|uniref:Uncharacterized protein n=1 Tax=Diversispora epigaea TaxID=1348612 RepID=A0A397IIE9_9GLOM|nr:hypothetical protein Glove_220g23 [Diversispora epigaea]